MEGNRVSACRNEHIVNDDLRVTYPIGNWAKPRLTDSRLFAFRDLASAKDFLKEFVELDRQYMEIWECELQGVTTKGIFSSGGCIAIGWAEFAKLFKAKKKLDFYNAYWFNRRGYDNFKSTIWASKIKLLKRVDK